MRHMAALVAAAAQTARAELARVLADPALRAFGDATGPPVGAYLAASGVASWSLLSSGPAALTATLMLLAAYQCYMGQLGGYWSYVDRCWSVLPVIYTLVFALWPGAGPRVVLMAVLVSGWGLRLTFNFARKGGYGREEDYRWPVLRAWFQRHDPLHPLGQELFSLLFVALYQHALIWAFVVPPLFVVARSEAPLGAADGALALLFAALLALEGWTDEVQWRFQRAKHALTPAARAAAGSDVARGFCTTGPFALSRHLNFFAEQCIWLVFYAFSWASGAAALNFSVAGAVLLVMLFQGSTAMTEALSRAKYREFAAYQRATSRLVPWWPGPSLDSVEGKLLLRNVAAAAALPAPAPAPAASGRRRQSFTKKSI